MPDNFGDRLAAAIKEKKSVAVIGIDPRLDNLPPKLTEQIEIGDIYGALSAFGKGIVDAVYDIVPAVKPNIAFFEAHGIAGIEAYCDICNHAREKNLLVIGDIKRGDIGSTAAAYANGHINGGRLGPHDALTLNPYLGTDSLQPFFDKGANKGVGFFALVKTSNPSSADLQDLELNDGRTVAQTVATLVNKLGTEYIGNSELSAVGAVVGATHPKELSLYREIMPNAPLLIPGYGAQGGNADDVVGAFRKDGSGAIVNASRSVIFAWKKNDAPSKWKEAARDATVAMNKDLITSLENANKWSL